MTVLLMLDLPMPHDFVEDISREMGSKDNPPDGLITHIVIDTAQGCR